MCEIILEEKVFESKKGKICTENRNHPLLCVTLTKSRSQEPKTKESERNCPVLRIKLPLKDFYVGKRTISFLERMKLKNTNLW